MKIEISIEKEDNGEKEMPEKPEMMDEQKAVIAKKLQKNIALTRMERKMLAGYLLEDED